MFVFARFLALVAVALAGGMALIHAVAWFASDGAQGRVGLILVGVIVVAGSIGFYRLVGRTEDEAREADTAVARHSGRFAASARMVAPALAVSTMVAILGVGGWLAFVKGEWIPVALAVGGLALFLLVAADLIRQALRPGPMLTLDARGIEHGAYGCIPWSEVSALHLERVRVRASTIHTLQVHVRDPARYLSRAPLFFRMGKLAWRRDPPATGALPIALNVLDRDPEVIAAAARSMHVRAGGWTSEPRPPASGFDARLHAPGLADSTEALEIRRRDLLARLRTAGTRIHVPNGIPAGERASSIALSVGLLIYGGLGVWVDDLFVPGRRSGGLHLHGGGAWMMFAAMLCACVVMLSVVVDHYDRSDNERHYRAVARVFRVTGWCCFGLSLASSIFAARA